MTFRDNFGIEILPDDYVQVLAYGDGARLIDVGGRSRVVRFGRNRVVIIDSDQWERSVSPGTLGVLDRSLEMRDGCSGRRIVAGYEANRNRVA